MDQIRVTIEKTEGSRWETRSNFSFPILLIRSSAEHANLYARKAELVQACNDYDCRPFGICRRIRTENKSITYLFGEHILHGKRIKTQPAADQHSAVRGSSTAASSVRQQRKMDKEAAAAADKEQGPNLFVQIRRRMQRRWQTKSFSRDLNSSLDQSLSPTFNAHCKRTVNPQWLHWFYRCIVRFAGKAYVRYLKVFPVRVACERKGTHYINLGSWTISSSEQKPFRRWVLLTLASNDEKMNLFGWEEFVLKKGEIEKSSGWDLEDLIGH